MNNNSTVLETGVRKVIRTCPTCWNKVPEDHQCHVVRAVIPCPDFFTEANW